MEEAELYKPGKLTVPPSTSASIRYEKRDYTVWRELLHPVQLGTYKSGTQSPVRPPHFCNWRGPAWISLARRNRHERAIGIHQICPMTCEVKNRNKSCSSYENVEDRIVCFSSGRYHWVVNLRDEVRKHDRYPNERWSENIRYRRWVNWDDDSNFKEKKYVNVEKIDPIMSLW